jgi:hypothetical protein
MICVFNSLKKDKTSKASVDKTSKASVILNKVLVWKDSNIYKNSIDIEKLASLLNISRSMI